MAVLIVCTLWLKRRNVTSQSPYGGLAIAASSPSLAFSNGRLGSGVSVATSPSTSRKISDAAARSVLAAYQAVFDQANSKSLDFYGRAIDQNGQPVVGAKVTGNVMTTVGFQGTKETPHVTETDRNGDFKFSGLRGESLGVLAEKEGYQFLQRDNGNWTDDYKADANNRVIFRMWKLKGAEPMIHTRLHAYISCDGSTNDYSLEVGRRLPSGNDLKVQLTRKPVDIVRGKSFDWSITLQIPSGGLIKMADIYPNEAPTQGYQPSITIVMPAGAASWTNSLSESYYFYNGKNYGCMTIDIIADFQPPPTLFDANIYINPSGSRNLEYDPARQINQ